MNRNKLLSVSQDLINEKKNGYKPPKQPTFKLSGSQVRDKMFQTLEKLYEDKKISLNLYIYLLIMCSMDGLGDTKLILR